MPIFPLSLWERVAPDKNVAVIPAEGGYPVIASASKEIGQLGILDHPLSRMMTTEVAATFPTLRQ
jgi:hypothetical protein